MTKQEFMTDLEKKIEELYNKWFLNSRGESAKDFLKSPEFKELAEWMCREAVENAIKHSELHPREIESFDEIKVSFNFPWFNKLWSGDVK